MIIGVPKEVKNNENRVAMTPAGVFNLKSAGHEVIIEKGADLGSSFRTRITLKLALNRCNCRRSMECEYGYESKRTSRF